MSKKSPPDLGAKDGASPKPELPRIEGPDKEGRCKVFLLQPRYFGSELVSAIQFQPITGEILRHHDLPMPSQGKRKIDVNFHLEVASSASIYPPSFYDSLCAPDVVEVVAAIAVMRSPSVWAGVKASQPSPPSSTGLPQSS